MPDLNLRFEFLNGVPPHLHIYLPDSELGGQMAADLSALVDAVNRIEDAGDATIALLNGVAAQLADMATREVDPAELQALADQLNSQSQELADAVVANTAANQPENPTQPQPQPEPDTTAPAEPVPDPAPAPEPTPEPEPEG